jgi:hypothetical protein
MPNQRGLNELRHELACDAQTILCALDIVRCLAVNSWAAPRIAGHPKLGPALDKALDEDNLVQVRHGLKYACLLDLMLPAAIST